MKEEEDNMVVIAKRDSRNELYRVTDSDCHQVLEWRR